MAFCFFQPFSRNWPGHIPPFYLFVSGYISGMYMLDQQKKTNLAPRIGSLDSPDSEDSPHICFIVRFP